MIADCYDLDMQCYFDRDSDSAGSTLKEIFDSVHDALADTYSVVRKRSALRIQESDGEDYTHIDVVPGRYVDDSNEDVFLHQDSGDKQYFKTNPQVHVDHIKDSGQREIIKLAKYWKHKNNLEVKTFVLELLVIEILSQCGEETLEGRFTCLLTELRDSIDNYAVEDPANPTGNDLSDLFDEDVRASLAGAAGASLALLEEGDYSDVFGEELSKEENEERALVASSDWSGLPIEDSSHAQLPQWPALKTPWTAQVRCFATSAQKRAIGSIQSSGQPLITGTSLKYTVATDVPAPYEVRWQVVNTGNDARRAGQLRGEFFRGKDLHGVPCSDQRVNYEATAYVGQHWIESFIIKDGRLVARSGRFCVRLLRSGGRNFRFVRR